MKGKEFNEESQRKIECMKVPVPLILVGDFFEDFRQSHVGTRTGGPADPNYRWSWDQYLRMLNIIQ